MSQKSASTPRNEAPAWLHEQVYGPKRQHTVDLVRASIEALQTKRQRISLASVAAMSKQLDPKGRGISQSAILHNEEARVCYEQQRTWRAPRTFQRAEIAKSAYPLRSRIAVDRDLARLRRRYLRLSKQELVERLIEAEQAYAEQEDRWLGLNDELLLWRLRAVQAEASFKTDQAAVTEH